MIYRFARYWVQSFLFVLVGFILVGSAHASVESIKKSGTLRVGLDPGFIPFEMKTSKGDLIGFDIDMITAFAKELGTTPKFIDTKWDGIIPALVTNKFDLIVSGMTVTPERSKAVLFSDVYYNAGLMAMISSQHTGKFKTLSELDNPSVTLVVKTGTTGDFYVKENFKKAKIQKLDSESDCANSVALGKATAFIYDKPYVQVFERQSKGKVWILDSLATVEGFGVAAKKSDKDLISAFNTFLAGWKKSGAYETAIKKHFVDLEWATQIPAN
jgi:polar amino acid transport system substrate-binding protein